ncbi:MAG: hypothetical protein IT431_16590 [Phycisphaerales bacterium]|nr:hypothetical protein [Phycisphaerales bacterium]
MTSPSGDGDKLAAVLTTLLGKTDPAPVFPERKHECIEPLVGCLIYSFLLWESAPKAAAAAFDSLCAWIIDPNELRVALPQEIVEWTGAKDRAALERADRMRASLNALFQREHRVTLAHLENKPKRDVREYIESLDGMPAFVAARVTLFAFHGHAIPTDRTLFELLVGEGVLDPSLALDEAERWLERQIRASDAEKVVPVLEAWRDAPAKPRANTKPAKTKPAKKAAPRTTPARGKKDA